MSELTFLGDVALLSCDMAINYEMEGTFIFNLEYVITEETELPKPGKVNLSGKKKDFLCALNNKPFAVSLANNHIMDFGEKGLNETQSFLDEANIYYFGAGSVDDNFNNPRFVIIGGRKIALIAYSMFNERIGNYGVSLFDKNKIKNDITYAKDQQAEVIIVSIHWGEEEAAFYNVAQKSAGHFLIDQGVDLVIGHHPHCIQPFEIYNGKYIFYSLGNCIFPDHSVEAFYDEINHPHRIFHRKWLGHNKKSLAVKFDITEKQVVSIDLLRFNRLVLTKIGSVSLQPKRVFHSNFINEVIKRSRKYSGFLWSNALINGKIFDFSALLHEFALKKKNK